MVYLRVIDADNGHRHAVIDVNHGERGRFVSETDTFRQPDIACPNFNLSKSHYEEHASSHGEIRHKKCDSLSETAP